MRIENASISDFLEADKVECDDSGKPFKGATVAKLTDYFLQGGQSGLDRLAQLATPQKLVVENVEDLSELKSWYLVWYKPNKKGEASWQYAGSENYTVAEYVAYVCSGNIRPSDENRVNEIRQLRGKLENGLRKNIILVAAFDTKVNKRVIVDGCKRTIALSLVAKENLGKVLASKYQVLVMELSSEWAHSLYPYDFIPFLESVCLDSLGRQCHDEGRPRGP